MEKKSVANYERDKTVGELSIESSQKKQETRSVVELQQEMQKGYVDNLVSCIKDNKKSMPENFFVVVITKRERLMDNVLRNYFFARSSCPTPDYDQSVFRYNGKNEELEYLWCVPDRETCMVYSANAAIVHKDERQLLQHVLDFADGTLFSRALAFNNEQKFFIPTNK